MKKRLLSLALCIIMLFGALAFTGCGSKDDEENEDIKKDASRNTKTLNMFVMTEDGTDPDQAAAVAEAINKITKSRFKTKLNISFYTEDEYYNTLEQKFADKQEQIELEKKAEKELKKYVKAHRKELGPDGAKKKFYEEHPEYIKFQETTVDPDAETTKEETVLNEDTGLLELKYPEADPNVIDIFYLGGEDRFVSYIDKEWVAKVDDELGTSSKKLNYYISTALMSSVKSIKRDGLTYAIPNNRIMGEYTYMLVNKELLAKYFYDISSMPTLVECREFLEDIAKFEPDVIPINGVPDIYNVLYWDIDTETKAINKDKFSIIGTTFAPNATLGAQLQFSSLFASKKAYRDQLLTNRLYEELGYFRSNVPEDAKCAIKIVKGGANLEKVYGDEYEMIVLENPHIESEDVFSHMFAVNGYSTEPTRAMEIITYINTNSELRNLLQYGIEGINYNLDANNQVVYTDNNKYFMDMNKTGNAFIAHTIAGEPLDIWDYGMKQNRDVTVDLILGFSLKDEKVNMDAVEAIQKISDDVEKRINDCKNYEELSALVDTLMVELRGQNNPLIKEYLNIMAESSDEKGSMPYTILYNWMTEMGYITEDEE